MQRNDLPKGSDDEDPDELVEMSHEEELDFRDKFLVPKNCSVRDFKKHICKCNLDDPIVVICTKASLQSIPERIQSSVKKINLGNNLIDNIEHVRWPEPLTNLVLIHNNLTHLKARAFGTVPNLSQLWLSHNQISQIDDEALDGLTSLTRLSIESNELTSFNMRILKGTPKITFIHLSENMINLPEQTKFGTFRHLKEIILDHNRITKIRSHWFSNSPTVLWISLAYNEISVIEPNSFEGSGMLAQLDLQFNKLKTINRQMFAPKLKIEKLDLAGNQLDTLPSDAFDDIIHLESLNLTFIEFSYLQRETFAGLRELVFIYFEKFRYCHYANHVRVCFPSTDGLSSARELLAFSTLKYAVWIVAFVCIVGNILVFIWRTISPHEDQTLSLFVKNLSIADLMMGIYLCAIGGADWKFQDNFGCHAIEWMSSLTCTGIGFLAILSSELSVFILSIITIERYKCITSINKNHEEAQKQRARIYVTLAWLLAFLIALYPILERVFRNSDYFATNGLCLPLHIDQPLTAGWQYSLFIYLGINFSAVLMIIYFYARMYTMIIDGRQTSRPVLLRSEKREDAILAIRLFFIVVVDCLCSIPIVVIKVMALANVSISASIYGWLVVFIIPINSALNPILYTLAAPNLFRDAVCRLFERLCYRIDLITAGSARESNYSSQSSSAGSTHSSAQQTMIASGAKRRLNNESSISTNTCDTFETSIISNSNKISAGLAIANYLQQPSMMLANHEMRRHHRSINANNRKLFSSYTTLPINLGNEDKFKQEINGKLYRHHNQYHELNSADNLNETIDNKGIETKTAVQSQPTFDCLVNYDVSDGDNVIKHKVVVPNNQTMAYDSANCELKQLVATLPCNNKSNHIQSVIVYDFLDDHKSFDDRGHVTDEDVTNVGKSIITDGADTQASYDFCNNSNEHRKQIMDNCRLGEVANCDLVLGGRDDELIISSTRMDRSFGEDAAKKPMADTGASPVDNIRVDYNSSKLSNGEKRRVSFGSKEKGTFQSSRNGSG